MEYIGREGFCKIFEGVGFGVAGYEIFCVRALLQYAFRAPRNTKKIDDGAIRVESIFSVDEIAFTCILISREIAVCDVPTFMNEQPHEFLIRNGSIQNDGRFATKSALAGVVIQYVEVLQVRTTGWW